MARKVQSPVLTPLRLPRLLLASGAGLLAAFLLLSSPAQAINSERCTAEGVAERFDDMFERAVKKHLPVGFDWCWLKAWAMAESNLDPDALSPVGAVGILQVMPATGEWISERYGGKLRDAAELKNAKKNIEIATLYIAHLGRFWSYPRSDYCRLQLQQASFNAGEGNVVRAQDLSGGRLCWSHIAAFLHQVTGQQHSEETISYVQRITENFLRLKGLI